MRFRLAVSSWRVAAVAAAATSCVAAGVASPASAECRNVWQPDISGETGGSLVLQCSVDDPGGSKKSGKAKKSKPKRPTTKQIRALGFTIDAAATTATRAAVAAKFTEDDDQSSPAVQQMRAAIESGEPESGLRSFITKRKWSEADLADIWAAATLNAWAVVHDRPVSSISATTVKTLRAQARTQFALDPKVRASSDSAQRRWADQLVAWVSAVKGVHDAAKAQGLEQLAAEYRTTMVNVYKYPSLKDVDQLASVWPLTFLNLEEAKIGKRGITLR